MEHADQKKAKIEQAEGKLPPSLSPPKSSLIHHCFQSLGHHDLSAASTYVKLEGKGY
jgi:hypothetical protein